MKHRKRIAIIGAGMGGLSAAAILARHCEVTVFERADGPGGKIRQIEAGGQPVDSGPTVFTMDWALERVFEQAGARLRDHVTLVPQEVLARHYWPDGTALDLFADIDRSADAISDVFGPDEAARYRQFCAQTGDVFETLRAPFMEAGAPSFLGLVSQRSPISLLKTAPFSTLWQHLTKAFGAPKLRQLFGRYATYCGASPFSAPATLMLVAHVEQAGVWALEGGMAALPRALETVATRNGARFVYGAQVDEIIEAGERVQGVRVSGDPPGLDGAAQQFDMVVMNGDVAALLNGSMSASLAQRLPPAPKAARSQSAMTWSALAEPVGQPLSYHTVFFSTDYPAEFDAVFKAGSVPASPTVYVCAPDRASGKTPEGPERVFCLINAPANGDTHPYTEQEIATCRQRMLDQLARCGTQLNLVPGTETVTTPETFATLFPETGGALYGMASHGWRASFQRPGVRTPVKGLYLAGGSVHPGPGVPMAALSGHAAAMAAVKDFALTSRSPGADIAGGISTPSARTAPTG
ncbi:MAG: 1-hydroxycarotenoid 3,4-desaturase CrtD [Pseudomonadota bacterium]